MKNSKTIIILLFAIIVIVIVGYYFWPEPDIIPRSSRRPRKSSQTSTESTTTTSMELSESIMTATQPILSESTVPIIFTEGALSSSTVILNGSDLKE